MQNRAAGFFLATLIVCTSALCVSASFGKTKKTSQETENLETFSGIAKCYEPLVTNNSDFGRVEFILFTGNVIYAQSLSQRNCQGPELKLDGPIEASSYCDNVLDLYNSAFLNQECTVTPIEETNDGRTRSRNIRYSCLGTHGELAQITGNLCGAVFTLPPAP